TITFNNPLAQRVELGYGVYALPYPNAAPIFDSTPSTQAKVGESYRYEAHAIDRDGLIAAYVLLSGPEGMSVDFATGVVTWEPQAGASAQAQAVLRAYDARG